MFRRYPRAVIYHPDLDQPVIHVLPGDLYLVTVRAVLDGVIQDIAESLLQPVEVPVARREQLGKDFHLHFLLFRLHLEDLPAVLQQLVDIDLFLLHLELAGLHPGELQQLINLAFHAVRLVADNGRRPLPGRIIAGGAVQQRLGETVNRGQGAFQLVRDVRHVVTQAGLRVLYLDRHFIEAGSKLPDFSRTGQRYLLVVVSFGHFFRGRSDTADGAVDRAGEEYGYQQ